MHAVADSGQPGGTWPNHFPVVMKIICVARNYRSHAREMNRQVDPSGPVFFLKPDTSLLDGDRPFYYPKFTSEIHYEVEVVIKISKAGKSIPAGFAGGYFEEIGLGVDLTARDLQRKAIENGHPWTISKAFDHSAVISPFVHKSSYDIENLKFSLKRGEQTLQSGNTADMIYPVQELIARISQFMTFKLGDMIFTGTPAGVGPIGVGDEFVGYLEQEKMFELRIK